VFVPPIHDSAAEVRLDYVGSLQNAAVVMSRLHRGEKRLVFVDSRARAEQLAQALRQLEVTTFVTHSSLSQEQRQAAEEAFASRDDCVIVATSVLELGIDVGDLDRVIQIDAPSTVSSFLQRMGRTGRRPGATRNCLFLATQDDTLVQAAGLIDLWATGYIEPIVPPLQPWHILAQQLMALALQENGIGRTEWWQWMRHVPGFSRLPRETIERLVEWMLQQQILWDDQGILALGREGEKTYGRRNFMALFSVFTSPPLFAVLHGRRELGFVDAMTFLGKQEGPRVLLLGGAAWRVNYIDWQRRAAYVEATDVQGRSRWKGERPGIGFQLCQAMQHLLATDDHRETWSQRARQQIEAVRAEFRWLDADGTVVVADQQGGAAWWTFAGMGANATLAHELAQATHSHIRHDSLSVTVEPPVSFNTLKQALAELRTRDVNLLQPVVDERAIEGLKFSECLPHDLALDMLRARLCDPAATSSALHKPLRLVYP
jgi:ATP-dependent Lhr-like helicase